MLPTSTELTYFYEAAVAANFSHAAKNLNISQPILSMAMKRLEDSLKTALFYWQHHGVLLTRAGTELFHNVHELLNQWKMIHKQMIAAHTEIKGRLVIGCNSAYVAFIADGISKLEVKRARIVEVEIIKKWLAG